MFRGVAKTGMRGGKWRRTPPRRGIVIRGPARITRDVGRLPATEQNCGSSYGERDRPAPIAVATIYLHCTRKIPARPLTVSFAFCFYIFLGESDGTFDRRQVRPPALHWPGKLSHAANMKQRRP